MKRSLHILADFYDCAGGARYFLDATAMEKKTLGIIRKAGFRIVSSRFHKFGKGSAGEGGITGVVIVSESHLTIHTWPERHFVNFDVFFCNYSRDNTKKVRSVFSAMKKIYQPKKIRRRDVWRD